MKTQTVIKSAHYEPVHESALPSRLMAPFLVFSACFFLMLPAQADDQDGVAKPPTVDFSIPAASPESTPESAAQASEPAPTNDPELASQASTKQERRFGESKITEYRRENGQVYAIELEHSSGNKQYIEQNDADGLGDARSNDPENEQPIAKWRLGSW